MATPYRVAIDASNQPTSAQNYEHGASALTGFLEPSLGLADGQRVILLAEQVDGNGAPAGAWEIVEATWNDSTTDFFSRDLLLRSSSGSLIDWSASGVNATPRLRVVASLEGSPVELVAAGTVSTGTSAIVIGVSPAFQPGWEYRIAVRNLTGSATAVLTALFWDSVAVNWSTRSFASIGLGARNSTYAIMPAVDSGYCRLQHPSWPVSAGNEWALDLALHGMGSSSEWVRGLFHCTWNYSGQTTHIECPIAMELGGIGDVVTGVAVAPSAGTLESGTWWCTRSRNFGV